MIRKGDTVAIMTGKDKGKTGKVLQIFPEKGRATVEKLNLVKRHQRPTQKMRQGGIVEKEASIHLSNLMLYCKKCAKPRRVKVKVTKDKTKGRVCVKCEEPVHAV